MSTPPDIKKTGESVSKANKVTPRTLVRKQVENEDFHVSEEDMTNLDTSIEASESEAKEFSEESDNNVKDKTATSYDILGE